MPFRWYNPVIMSQDSVIDRLNASYDRLSTNNRILADFIFENIDEVVLSSAGRVARLAGVSESSVVRFSQSLGYRGYPDLKNELIRFYREQMTPSKKFQGYLQSIKNDKQFYAKIANQEIEYLQQSINTIDDETLDKAADMLVSKAHRYVYATSGSNDPLATNLAFRLNRFKLRTTAVHETGVKLFERFIQFNQDDFVIHYSFYKPRSDHLALMDYLRKKQIPNLLITDSLVPEVVRDADLVLFARRGPFGIFHSLIIPLAITNALLVAVAQKLGDNAIAPLEELNAIRECYSVEDRIGK